MKKGDFVNMYNSHNKDGRPDYGTLCGKGILIKPYKPKHELGEVWDEFESWSVFVFWDRLGNAPTKQQVWFVHPNDLMDKVESSKEHWTHWAEETKKACDKILKTLSERKEKS